MARISGTQVYKYIQSKGRYGASSAMLQEQFPSLGRDLWKLTGKLIKDEKITRQAFQNGFMYFALDAK